jgi:hypothetical protein
MISVELGVLLHRAPSAMILHVSALLLSTLAGLTAGTATAARAENARAMKVDEMSFIGEMQIVRSWAGLEAYSWFYTLQISEIRGICGVVP